MKLFNIIKSKENQLFVSLKGNLKVFGLDRDKRLVHIDNGSNTVTTWAKQMIMKNFAGAPYLAANTTDVPNVNYVNKIADASHSATINSDGSNMSNLQHFNDISLTQLKGNHGTDWLDAYVPNFPTKMLFGTGIEMYSDTGTWKAMYSESGVNGTNINLTMTQEGAEKFISYSGATALADLTSTTYGSGVANNLYSNIFDGTTGVPENSARTVDTLDPTYLANIKSTFSASSYAITGAIKNNNYETKATQTMFTIAPTNTAYVLDKDFRGVGKPSFIYIDRTSIDSGSASNIYVNKSTGSVSNRITYSIIMPSQAEETNYYYPYNGYYLREAGLYTDARLYNDIAATSNKVPEVADGDIYTNYNKMLFGTLLAKRRIATIYKAYDNSYTFSWTLYIE